MKLKLLLATLASVATLSAAVVSVSSNITTDTTWTAGNEYVLTDVIFVTNGATLTINEGVVVRGEPKSDTAYDPGTLVISRDGQINASGSPANPIIFTTAALEDNLGDTDGYENDYDYSTSIDYNAELAGGATFVDSDPAGSPLSPGEGYVSAIAGDTSHLGTPGGKYSFDSDLGSNEYRGLWGGVIILGNAPTNCIDIDGVSGIATATTKGGDPVLNDIFEGFIEGLAPANYGSLGVYGGSNPNDSSGTFRYVSIRHGGTNIAADNEINGLTMGGVGFGTKLEYVEVYCNNDDGFEWFGGTVNSRYLVSLYNNDDSFDIDDGFTGLGQFWFSLQIDDNQNGDHGGEHDGTNGNHDNIDVASLNDTTLSGTGDAGIGIPVAFPTIYNATYIQAGSAEHTLKHEDSFGGNYYNSIFVGDGSNEFLDAGSEMSNRIAAGDADFVSNSYIYNHDGVSDDANLGSAISDNDNVFSETVNPLNNALGNVRQNVDPRATSAAPGGLSLEPVTATFFISASYAGAFNPQETSYWTDGWSVFSASVDNK